MPSGLATATLLTVVLNLLFLVTNGWGQQTPKPSERTALSRSPSLEDWSSLSLASSQLRAEPPVLGEKDEEALFTRELLQVQWRSGDPIDLYVIKPKGVARPPVILYLYSYPAETDRFRDNHYCERITAGGFAAVGFVSALTGQRYQNRPMKQWFVSEMQEALGSSVHDVQMVLNYLASRNDLDPGRVGIFGVGSGGTIAILSAAVDTRIKTIDALDPWGDWPEWVAASALIPEEERPVYRKPEYLKSVAPLDPVQFLPQLHSVRLRIQELMDDPVTPKGAKERIESAAPSSAQLVHYTGDLELYTASSGGRLFQWIKDQLRSAGDSQSDEKLEKTRSPGN